MLIDRLTEFANEQYQEPYSECTKIISSRCQRNRSCLHDLYLESCSNGLHIDSYQCECCFDEIHSGEATQSYSCPNSCYAYICKYTHKYATEAYKALEELELATDRGINVISFGCGPATELCALDRLQQENIIASYNYFGVDLNTNWGNIHNFYTSEFEDNLCQVNFSITDANNYLSAEYIRDVDVIIFNYFLSDMIRFSNYQNARRFVNRLAAIFRITNNYPAIVLNDIAVYYRGRSATSLVDQFLAGLTTYNSRLLRFFDSNSSSNSRHYLLGAGFIASDDTELVFEIPEYCDRYNPYRYLGSAQIILQQRQENDT